MHSDKKRVFPFPSIFPFLALTYIYHVGDIVDVVFGHQGISSCQIEKIVIPGLCAFHLVFRVLGLSLGV